jgi:hypothetical protein
MSVLYQTGFTPDGIPLLGGIYRLKDQEGFPVDMAYELCRDKGVCPDWAEFLADAGSQKDWKFDDAFHEIEMLCGKEISGEIMERFKIWGQSLIGEGDDFISICKKMLAWKRGKRT